MHIEIASPTIGQTDAHTEIGPPRLGLSFLVATFLSPSPHGLSAGCYTTVSPYDGPTYACCGTSDGIASWRTMQSRLESLSALGIPTEFHSYNGLPHGFGLGTGTVAEGWLQDAVHFWQSQSGATSVRSTKANTKQSDTIYSLNGTRRHAMQKGVSIVNGKKVITK